MKYLIWIQSNPGSRAVWDTYSEMRLAGRGRARAALNEELMASGAMIVAGDWPIAP